MSELTDTVTIRVPITVKRKLEEQSKKNQSNVNLLINQILVKNLQWDEHMTKMGWLQFNPSTIKAIFNYLTEEQIEDIAKTAKSDALNGIKFIFGDTSFEHTVEFMDSWLKSTNVAFRHTEDSDVHKFLVNHTIGKNWSIFATKISEEFITELGHKITDICANTDSYSYTIAK